MLDITLRLNKICALKYNTPSTGTNTKGNDHGDSGRKPATLPRTTG